MFEVSDSYQGLASLRVPQVEVETISPVNKPVKFRKTSGYVNGEFVKGPIPLYWLGRACTLPGKAVNTALAIWFEQGRRKRLDRLSLTSAIAERFGVSPSAKSRALKAMEGAGLIHVERRGRKNPLVTILDAGS